MYCKTITKGIFDSYIANDSDSVLEGVVTNTFEGTAFRRFVRVPFVNAALSRMVLTCGPAVRWIP